MSEIINKELLSEVLESPVKILSIDENKCEIRNSISFENYQLGISYTYLYGNKETRFMTIHELAHKCKEWASNQGYRLMSCQDKDAGYCEVMKAVNYPPLLHSEICDLETEAIFKACQWILDNKEK